MKSDFCFWQFLDSNFGIFGILDSNFEKFNFGFKKTAQKFLILSPKNSSHQIVPTLTFWAKNTSYSLRTTHLNVSRWFFNLRHFQSAPGCPEELEGKTQKYLPGIAQPKPCLFSKRRVLGATICKNPEGLPNPWWIHDTFYSYCSLWTCQKFLKTRFVKFNPIHIVPQIFTF